MAKAVRRCVVCRKLFAANQRRKTCSDECHFQLASTISKELRTRKVDESNGTMVRGENPGHTSWEPSPEYIQEQCRLIKAGLLVIKEDVVERVEPAS